MKKSELIKILQEIPEDFDIKVMDENHDKVDIGTPTINIENETITIWEE